MDLKLGRIGQIALTATDMDATVEFYQGKLGLPLTMRPHPGMAFFDCGGQTLLLSLPEAGQEAKTGGAVLYFDCEDIAVGAREMAARGVVFVSPPHRVAQLPAFDLWMAFFEDPNKNLLALQMRGPKGYALPEG